MRPKRTLRSFPFFSGNTNVNSYEVDVEESAITHRDREVAAAVNPIPDDQQEKLLVDGARLARERNRAAT